MRIRRITSLRPLLLALGALALAIAGVGAAAVLRPTPAPPAAPRPVCSPALPCLALVVDDLGRDQAALERLLGLDAELTFSVLPGLAGTRPATEAIQRARRELMLHLPMAPDDPTRVSDEPIVLGTGAHPLGPATESCVREIPGALAFNNHMGSALTRDAGALRAILAVARARGLAALDSRTTPGSQLCRVARELGMGCLERDLFLDDPARRDVIRSVWFQALRLARSRGWAILIAHPHSLTIELLPALLQARGGVRIVRYSELLRAVDAT